MAADVFARWLAASAPSVSVVEAAQLARQHYGLLAGAKALYAERDCNFRLALGDGSTAILKVNNADLSEQQVRFQNRVLSHLAATDPALPTPRVIPALDGRQQFAWTAADGRTHQVRLLSWLPGETVNLYATTDAEREQLGRDLARVGVALRSCDPAGAPVDLPWDLRNTARLRSLAQLENSPALQAEIDATLLRFEQWVQPALAALPAQLIHNDLNPDNVLFDQASPRRVSGFIDFGDMVCAPLICDLAVACTYQLRESGDDPLAELLPMVCGYCAVTPLAPAELALLPTLVQCRLLMTLLIQGWRSERSSGPYRQSVIESSREASGRLLRLAGLDHAQAGQRLAESCLPA
jgi:Ser/Thr protein kinase RdoA (MazF antagonist)